MHAKYQGQMSNGSAVRAHTDGQTDGRYQVHYLSALPSVKMYQFDKRFYCYLDHHSLPLRCYLHVLFPEAPSPNTNSQVWCCWNVMYRTKTEVEIYQSCQWHSWLLLKQKLGRPLPMSFAMLFQMIKERLVYATWLFHKSSPLFGCCKLS